jgi:hypothetical protein
MKPAARIQAGHYLDGAAFTRLFEDRKTNHAQICVGLALIAAGVTRRFYFGNFQDQCDATAAAMLLCVEKIDRFVRGGNAFSFFSAVARNEIRYRLRVRARQRARATTFTDFNTGAGLVAWRACEGIDHDALEQATPYARAS